MPGSDGVWSRRHPFATGCSPVPASLFPSASSVVHHALVRVIEPCFEPRWIEDSYACRKGKGTHAGMRRALEFALPFPWAMKCDIRRYFPSIGMPRPCRVQ